MVAAGPFGSTGTVSAARAEVVEDVLDLYEWVIEGRTVIVEGVGADIAHERGE